MNENLIIELEKSGIVTATFRKLAPDKKKTIYHSALEAFAKSVFDRVSLDEIACGAEISKGSLVQYFTHKENILAFTVEVFLDNYQEHWDDYFQHEHAVRVRDRLQLYINAHLDYTDISKAESDFLLKMLFENSHEYSEQFRETVRQMQLSHFQSFISRAVQTGEIRAGAQKSMIAGIFLKILVGIFQDMSLGKDQKSMSDRDDYIKGLLAVIFDGLSG